MRRGETDVGVGFVARVADIAPFLSLDYFPRWIEVRSRCEEGGGMDGGAVGTVFKPLVVGGRDEISLRGPERYGRDSDGQRQRGW